MKYTPEGACDPLLSPTVPLRCWVFNCASATGTPRTRVRTTTITIIERTRLVTTAIPSACATHDARSQCAWPSLPAAVQCKSLSTLGVFRLRCEGCEEE